MKFTYVYVLQSEIDPKRHYTGLTDNLKDRLRRHNSGDVPHTAKHRPWKIKTVTAFEVCSLFPRLVRKLEDVSEGNP